jgi:NADH dehydrogenase
MQSIVIVGGGAGGLELATRLGDSLGKARRSRVVLVDRWPAHFWKPLLHTVAAGKRDPQLCQIEYSAQAAEHGFEFVQGEVRTVDRGRRMLELAPLYGGDGLELLPRRTLRYDRLVLALGSVTNFFGIPGAASHALTLDDVGQADLLRRRFIDCCIRAGARKKEGDAAGGQVNIVIVGGGATGVELAAELVHSVRALARYNVHALDPARDVRIRLIERGEYLLPHLHRRLCKRAARHLRSLGIEVLTGTAVARVTADAVHDAAGCIHRSDITLWAAGVEAPPLCATLGLPVNRLRQIAVSPSLQTLADPDIFALGDCAAFVCPGKGQVPPRAQVAHQQAMFLADALARPASETLPAFAYHDYGSLVSLGPLAAVGVLTGQATGREWLLSGVMARVLYRLMYQKHMLALRGFVRMAAQTAAEWIRAKIQPPVKLH